MRIRKRLFTYEQRRQRRILLPKRTAVYHVMSRTVRQQFWFGAEEKEVFRALLAKQAFFSGIEVLTFCLMDNHFHLLVRIPPCPLEEDGTIRISDEELMRRYERLYDEEAVPLSSWSVPELREILAANGDEAREARERIVARMGNLSAFMRELKQRFGIWFNHRHQNTGTIWSARFKSLLVENSPEVLAKVAAYIDLNPVRAEIVTDPVNYRWCGYGEAMAGGKTARLGICGLFSMDTHKDYVWAVRSYRLILYGKGNEFKRKGTGEAGSIDRETVAAVLRAGGKVSLQEALRCRVRYFSDAQVIGSKSFLDSFFNESPDCFGPRRTRSGRAVRGNCWSGLWSMRDLKRAVFS